MLISFAQTAQGQRDGSAAPRTCNPSCTEQREMPLAKPNYQFDKRQRDLAKKKKQDEKRQRKLAKGPDDAAPSPPDDPQTR